MFLLRNRKLEAYATNLQPKDLTVTVHYVYNDNFDRKGLWYKTKSRGGNWSGAKRFYHENNLNSYPTLVEDNPGEWIAVWDSSNEPYKKRTAIRFGRLQIGN